MSTPSNSNEQVRTAIRRQTGPLRQVSHWRLMKLGAELDAGARDRRQGEQRVDGDQQPARPAGAFRRAPGYLIADLLNHGHSQPCTVLHICSIRAVITGSARQAMVITSVLERDFSAADQSTPTGRMTIAPTA
jgi:hypothetical protein